MRGKCVYILIGRDLDNQNVEAPCHYMSVYDNRKDAEQMRDMLTNQDAITGKRWKYSVDCERVR